MRWPLITFFQCIEILTPGSWTTDTAKMNKAWRESCSKMLTRQLVVASCFVDEFELRVLTILVVICIVIVDFIAG